MVVGARDDMLHAVSSDTSSDVGQIQRSGLVSTGTPGASEVQRAAISASEVVASGDATQRAPLAAAPDYAKLLQESGANITQCDPLTLEICAKVAEKFGVNSHVESQVVANLHTGFNSAIKRLAEELYSKQIHFVLEILQNCDDNDYEEHCKLPKLEIVIEHEALTFANNERGFSERNVMALSAIGESTKASSSGYIGQKGIGFKSVFKATSHPQVHSGHYHFAFNGQEHGVTHTSSLAYIIPVPLPTPGGWDAEHGGTLIRLPLCKKYGRLDIKEVRAKVRDIHSSLLLFLNKLRCIIIRDVRQGEDGSVQRVMERREESTLPFDNNDNNIMMAPARGMQHVASTGKIVCIDETNSDQDGGVVSEKKERWLLVSKELVPTLERNEKIIPLTRVAVAIPLAAHPADKDLPKREVFAFLPLRNYGLSFVVQADFIVPSSREAVDASHEWNQWLREEAHVVFVDACMMLVDLGTQALDELARKNSRRLGGGISDEEDGDDFEESDDASSVSGEAVCF
jgi:hypothetical protein